MSPEYRCMKDGWDIQYGIYSTDVNGKEPLYGEEPHMLDLRAYAR